MTRTVSDAWKWLTTAASDAVKLITNRWQWMVSTVSDAWKWLKTAVFDAMSAALNALGTVVNWLWKNVVQPAWNGITTSIQTACGIIKPILDGLGIAFQTAFGMVKAAVDLVAGPITTVANAVTAVGNAVGSLGGAPAAVNTPGRSPTPRTLGHGATGAVVTRATMAVIGEAGPEMVVPLSKMPGASPLGGWGGGDIVVHVESPVYIDGREIARAHRRQVIKAMAAGA